MKKKFFYIIVIFFVFYLLSFFFNFEKEEKPKLGLSFSEFYARNLGIDWKVAYEAILNELNPNSLILIAYWNYIEPQKNYFDFSSLDYEINLASIKGKEIILAVGQRVPRWPECHIPDWAANLKKEEFDTAFINYIETVVKRYAGNQSIKYWQVENEPYFSYFGNCPPFDEKLFEEEINVVRKYNNGKPVMVTDSGELSLWIKSAKNADVFGSTLYRKVDVKYMNDFSYFFIPPFFYTLKSELVKLFTDVSKVVISELQGEPWSPKGISLLQMGFDQQTKKFTTSTLVSNFKYALKTGFDEIYFWGAEWWYYRKVNGDDSFWNVSKKIFSGDLYNAR